MKKCGDCLLDKPLLDFNRKGNGYQSRCRACQKAWYKKYYNNNPKEKVRLLSKNAEDRDRIRAFVRSAKDRPCFDCGIKYPYYVMQFDHVDSNKEYNVSQMITCASIELVSKEIAKCEVVCANCHAERTHKRRLSMV